jgi:hypothetical protein
MAAPMKKMASRANFVISVLSKAKYNQSHECLSSKITRIVPFDVSPNRCFVSRLVMSSNFVNLPNREGNPNPSSFRRYHSIHVHGYTTLAERKCWNCGRKNGFDEERFFCRCGIIQEVPDDITYFDVLGVEKVFDLELTELKKNFMQYQMKLHPDKYSQKSKVCFLEKKISRQSIHQILCDWAAGRFLPFHELQNKSSAETGLHAENVNNALQCIMDRKNQKT